MLKKLITGILALAMCASTLAALPQGARAAGPDPTPVIVVDPEEPTPPVEPGEPEEPEEPGISPNCEMYPEDDPASIIM